MMAPPIMEMMTDLLIPIPTEIKGCPIGDPVPGDYSALRPHATILVVTVAAVSAFGGFGPAGSCRLDSAEAHANKGGGGGQGHRHQRA